MLPKCIYSLFQFLLVDFLGHSEFLFLAFEYVPFALTWTFILFSLSHFHGDTWSVSREKNLSPLRPLKSLMYEVLKRLPFWCWDNPAIVIFVYHLNHARGHNSYNDTELGHVFGPSGVDIQIILDRFGKKNNVVSGLLFFLGLVWVCTNSWWSW